MTPADATARWTQISLAVVALGGLLLRSRAPSMAVAVTAGATAASWFLGLTADPFLLTGFAVFTLAESRGGRRFPWWMFAGTIVVVAATMVLGSEGLEDRLRGILLGAIVLSVAWVLGVRTRAVERESAARSRAEERLRLAHDVHDVLSHSLGTIGVRAGVAAHVTTLDRDELRRTLGEIEDDARSSLADLRQLLDRERTDAESEAPLTSAALLADVARSAESAGVDVRLDSDDRLETAPTIVRTTVLRIVQESLTNVIRHSGAATATVVVRVAADTVMVRVVDDGHGAPTGVTRGHGLRGMQERVDLVGGTIDVASSPTGFSVHAVIPLAVETNDRGAR
ncbi:sensor histidine kinase [Agromyces atrinae]|uniref:sensor histidine kinase n=1 Tax=Agromyces atrinae TaxID=592376 RepID=UPI001F5A1104|nr:sensor histidine kinase [Agromyces atrinae]MCI2958724.1 sensor histidine kinase [Agromyces atrinae]